jgi:hypothetical protein
MIARIVFSEPNDGHIQVTLPTNVCVKLYFSTDDCDRELASLQTKLLYDICDKINNTEVL